MYSINWNVAGYKRGWFRVLKKLIFSYKFILIIKFKNSNALHLF